MRSEKVVHARPPKSEDLLALDAAKARKESILADKHEFQLAIDQGKYVPREVIQMQAATIMAALAQGLRSVSDKLERKGISTDVCIAVDEEINHALNETSKSLALIGGEL